MNAKDKCTEGTKDEHMRHIKPPVFPKATGGRDRFQCFSQTMAVPATSRRDPIHKGKAWLHRRSA
ncbi:MAG: hypothetical protein LBC41_10375 [Clostridiales bacterium]|nr:hypothetical protein [Clostridiales bacterium]MDR2751057.1 hypothetical protein [Clostridiales bacterium]